MMCDCGRCSLCIRFANESRGPDMTPVVFTQSDRDAIMECRMILNQFVGYVKGFESKKSDMSPMLRKLLGI